MRTVILLLVLLPLLAAAQQKIYKQVHPDGSVSFSDEPMSDEAEEIELPPLSVVETDGAQPSRSSAAAAAEEEDDATTEPAVVYTQMQFTSPRPEENIWGTGGQVLAAVATLPPLATGHRIRYVLDGTIITETRSTRVALADVFRGEHSLGADIIDETGRVLKSAPTVVFHMKQQSVLNPSNPANRPSD